MRFIAYSKEDVGKWATMLQEMEYWFRRFTISYPRPYEVGLVTVSAFEHTAR